MWVEVREVSESMSESGVWRGRVVPVAVVIVGWSGIGTRRVRVVGGTGRVILEVES